MRNLSTIQKREKLNTITAIDESGNGGACHKYAINERTPNAHVVGKQIAIIEFQNGPRNEENSVPGVIDTDLLEIVRDRLKSFQAGEFATEYNAQALLHVEEALMWLNRRVEDRIERQVLGTSNK